MSAVLTKTEYIDLITALLPDNNARAITESIMREMFQKLLLRDRVVLNSENLLFKENGSSDSELQSGDIVINRYESDGEWYLDFKRFLGGDSEDPGNYVSAIRLGAANITDLQATLADYVKKSFYSNYAFNGSGENASIPVNPSGYTDIRLTNNSLVSIGGMDLSLITGNSSAEQPFNGKPYLLRNLTTNPVVIKHDYSEAAIPFFTNDSLDLTVPVGGIVYFTFDFGKCEVTLKSWDDSIPVSSGGDIVYNIGIASQYSFGGWGISTGGWATPPREICSITSITSWGGLYNGTTITDGRIGKLLIPSGYKLKEVKYNASESGTLVSQTLRILAFNITSNLITDLQTIAHLNYTSQISNFESNLTLDVTTELTRKYITFALNIGNSGNTFQQGIISIILTKA